MENYLTPIECMFVRQTMLRQEKMYKEQVQELHHLYKIQKTLVAEINRRSLASHSNQEFFKLDRSNTSDPLGRAVNHSHQFFPLKKEPDKIADCSKATGIRRTFDLEQLPDEGFDDELESEANTVEKSNVSCCNSISDVQLGLSCEWEKKPANFSMKRSREQEGDHSRIVKPKHQFTEAPDFASRSNPAQARNGFTFEEHSFGRERQVIDLQEKPAQQNHHWLFQGPERLENSSWNVRQPAAVPQNFGYNPVQTKNSHCNSRLQLSHAHEGVGRVNEVSSGPVGSLLGSYKTSLEVPLQTAFPYAWREETFSSALESNSAWQFGAVNRHQPTPVIITRGEKGVQEAVPSSWYRQQGIGYSHSQQNPHQGAVLPAVTSNSAIHPWQTSGSGYFSGGLFALPSASASSPIPFTVNGLPRVQGDISRHSWVLGNREPPFATTPTTAPFKKPLNSVIKEGEVRLDEISQNLKVDNGSEAESGKVLKLQQGDRNGVVCNNEVYSFKEHIIPSRVESVITSESSESLKPFANLHGREINVGSCIVGHRNFYRETGSISLLGQASYGSMNIPSACNLESRPWSDTNELQQNHKLEAQESAVNLMSNEGDRIFSYEGRPSQNGMDRPALDERDFVELMSEKAAGGSSCPKVHCNQELQLVERGRKPASEQGNLGSNGDGLETTRQQCQGAAQSECGELSASIDLLTLQRGEKEKQDGLADDIANLAASVLMSLTLDKMPSEGKESSPPLLKKSVAWFANTLCSNKSSSLDMELERKSRNSPELDDFEAATLQLKGSELGIGLVTEQRKGQVTDDSTPPKSSNGGRSSRRGKKQRDFQNETLPSIASLSRQEITEDLQIMGGLMRSTRESARWSAVDKSLNCNGFQSETAGKRGTKYFSISRAKVSPVSPLDVEDSCGSPKKQGRVVEALPWLVTWGESTRRKRKQRQRICVSQKLRATLSNSKSTR